MTTLDEHLADGFDVPDDDEGRERFAVDGPEKANWALRKLSEIQARQAENAAIAEWERKRITEWLENDPQNRALARDRAFFEALLADWWRGQLAKMLADVGGRWDKLRVKSHTFPNGTVGARYSEPVPAYEDDDAVVAWFKSHDLAGFVAVKEAPKRDEVKAAIKAGVLAVQAGHVVHVETGELIPGVTVTEVSDPLEIATITVKAV